MKELRRSGGSRASISDDGARTLPESFLRADFAHTVAEHARFRTCETDRMEEQRRRGRAQQSASYLEALGRGDVDAIAAHVTDGFVNDHASALGSTCIGRDEYRRRLPAFLASMPGLRYEAGEPIVDGDRVAAPYLLRATGTAPDGAEAPVEIRGVMLLRYEGDLIAERLDVWDSLTYLRQTGRG
jgi:ketosteroid isomerase-like protein